MTTGTLADAACETKPRLAPSDMGEIMRLAADALGCYAELAEWHRDRAVARGLQRGVSAILLKGAMHRAARLAGSLEAMLATNQDITPRDWRRWTKREFYQLYRSRHRILNAAEREFWASGTDRSAPEFDQLHELEHVRGMYDAIQSIAFIRDAIDFTLNGQPPLSFATTDRWLVQVATDVASLFATLRACER